MGFTKRKVFMSLHTSALFRTIHILTIMKYVRKMNIVHKCNELNSGNRNTTNIQHKVTLMHKNNQELHQY